MPNSAMPIKDVSKLSPDGFSRFFMLVDILVQIYGTNGRKLRILDVGGGSEFFGQQLRKAGIENDLTVLDIIEKPKRLEATYIQGDATSMEFSDKSFDVVVSTDVLEHIPQTKKQAFVDECLRVAKELCIVAAPFDTEGVNSAEVAVNEFNKKLFGSGQDWLEEHLEFGKPTIDLMAKTLKRKKIEYADFGTQNIQTWLLNTHLNLIEAKLGLDSNRHSALNQFYNEHILLMGECQPPTYRHFFIAFIEPKHKKAFDVSKYTTSRHDSDKKVEYTSRLMDLLAERISSQLKDARRLEEAQYHLEQQKRLLEEELTQLKARADEQERTLQKYAPLIKLVRNKPARKVYALLRTLKSFNAKDS